MKKRLLLIATAMMFTVTSLTGCSSLKKDEVVAKVNDTELTAGVANFYARYMQAMYETYYGAYLGDNMWSTEAEEGKTYEESVKDSVLESLETMIVLEQHMDDYNVSLSDADKELVEKTAKQFDEDNSLENKEKIMADTGSLERLLTLIAIEQKMTDAIEADADTEVSDEEAAQKSMDYVLFSYTKEDAEGSEEDADSSEDSAEMTDEEKAAVRKEAEEFAKAANEDSLKFKELAEEAEVEVQTVTFDSESETPSADLIKNADKLEKGEITGVVETDDGCYVACVTSLMDKDATESKKAEIVEERKSDLYDEVTEKWMDDAKIKVYKKVWEKIDFNDVSVTIKQTEQDPYSDEIQTDDQSDGSDAAEE
ncbi:MAG: peptidyl-prolyl cis-trans isomerase [Lachnospiraceae bacterium]